MSALLAEGLWPLGGPCGRPKGSARAREAQAQQRDAVLTGVPPAAVAAVSAGRPLPEWQRQAVVRALVAGMTWAEAAEAIGVGLRSVARIARRVGLDRGTTAATNGSAA